MGPPLDVPMMDQFHYFLRRNLLRHTMMVQQEPYLDAHIMLGHANYGTQNRGDSIHVGYVANSNEKCP